MDQIWSSISYLSSGAAWLPMMMCKSLSSLKQSGVQADAVFGIVKSEMRPYIRLAVAVGCISYFVTEYKNYRSSKKVHKDSAKRNLPVLNISKQSKTSIIRELHNQQFYTAMGLIGAAFSTNPKLTVANFLISELMRSGPVYYYVLTKDDKFLMLVQFGESLQIIAWLSVFL